MLLEYLQAALGHAKYEILPDDRSYYGEIPECNGVYANAATLEQCREELREVLEEWILFRVHKQLPLPVVDGIEQSDIGKELLARILRQAGTDREEWERRKSSRRRP